jgi:DNA-nicking Smr family endonuclease
MVKRFNRPFRALRALKKDAQESRTEPAKSEERDPESFAEVAERDGVRRARSAHGRVAPPQVVGRRPVEPVSNVEHCLSIRVDGEEGEIVEGRRDDTEPVVLSWLLRQEPRRTLDLHRMGAAEARRAVHRFVRSRARHGEEVVLVITGRGRRAKSSPVLRVEAPEWLAEPSVVHCVRAFVTAPPRWGGPGALLVLLAVS